MSKRTAKQKQLTVVSPKPRAIELRVAGASYRLMAGEGLVGQVYVDHKDVAGSERLARQMAAAPDLLEACKRLLKFNEELCEDVGVSKHYPSADFARKLIADLEGK